MNIELMKKLADLEQTRNQHFTQLSQVVDQKKEQYIKEVVSDFSKFFQEKEFNITAGNHIVEATYGNLKAILSHDDPSTDYFGVLFRFDLDLEKLNKSKITVILNRKEPGLSFSSSIYSSSDSEESKLNAKITTIEKEIVEVTTRLKNIDQEKWSLFIKSENQNPGYRYSEPYASMYDLLTDLFK